MRKLIHVVLASVIFLAFVFQSKAVTPSDGSLPTYSASFTGLIPAQNATDLLAIQSVSATKVIHVKRISVSGISTGTSTVDVVFLKRTTLNAGGTSTVATNVSYDSTDAAATAVIRGYTANPTLGTLGGSVLVRKVTLPASASGILQVPLILDFAIQGDRSFTLQGTEQGSINWNAQVVVGQSLDIDVTWTEE